MQRWAEGRDLKGEDKGKGKEWEGMKEREEEKGRRGNERRGERRRWEGRKKKNRKNVTILKFWGLSQTRLSLAKAKFGMRE